MSRARAILEAETPKGVLKSATAHGTLGHADKALREIGFTRINDKTWARRDQWDRNYVRLRTPILTSIWWDDEAQEWCRKRELCQRNGHKQIGFDAHTKFSGLYPF